MKIAILHDFFEIKGGGERLVLTLARHLNADLIYGFWRPTSYALDGIKARSLNAYTPLIGWRTVKQIRAFQRVTGLDAYDVVIYSGNDALFARPTRTKRGNIYYCHTPPRYLYDKRQFYRDQYGLAGKAFLSTLSTYQRPRYEKFVRMMDTVVANSHTTQQRLSQFLHQDSVVVYPPCDLASFRWQGQGDYYISTARLDTLKNVEMIVEAFRGMPDKKLIVVSGGVHEERIRSLAEGHDTITVRGWVDEAELRTLLGNCIASVYVPMDEDFGMSPVESMAAGKPVIGVSAGGLKETIIHKQTGILLKPDFSVDNLREAIRWMSPERSLGMRSSCETRAQEFSEEKFLAGMDAIIDQFREALKNSHS